MYKIIKLTFEIKLSILATAFTLTLLYFANYAGSEIALLSMATLVIFHVIFTIINIFKNKNHINKFSINRRYFIFCIICPVAVCFMFVSLDNTYVGNICRDLDISPKVREAYIMLYSATWVMVFNIILSINLNILPYFFDINRDENVIKVYKMRLKTILFYILIVPVAVILFLIVESFNFKRAQERCKPIKDIHGKCYSHYKKQCGCEYYDYSFTYCTRERWNNDKIEESERSFYRCLNTEQVEESIFTIKR